MYNIKIRNRGLLSYGTVQSKWAEQTIWPGPTASRQTDRPKMLLQNIHNHVCTRLWCPNSNHIMNPQHCEHLKSHTKNY